MTKVVHCKKSSYDVYIGRPSIWGNPFEISKDGSRNQVIEKYEDYLLNSKELLVQLPTLAGKILGCWCSPLACHGDVLVKYANQENLDKWIRERLEILDLFDII
jgi:hypothetical protein